MTSSQGASGGPSHSVDFLDDSSSALFGGHQPKKAMQSKAAQDQKRVRVVAIQPRRKAKPRITGQEMEKLVGPASRRAKNKSRALPQLLAILAKLHRWIERLEQRCGHGSAGGDDGARKILRIDFSGVFMQQAKRLGNVNLPRKASCMSSSTHRG